MSDEDIALKKNQQHGHQVVPANQGGQEEWDPRSESLMTRLGLNARSYTRAPTRLTCVPRRISALASSPCPS